MSYLVSKQISDLRSEFEGGKSLSLDFFGFLQRGARNTLSNINPDTLKRRVPIFGGLTDNLAIYYCPEDVIVPSAIYTQPNDRQACAIYTAPHEFFCQNRTDRFTIEYINGVRFLLVRRSVNTSSILVNEMDSTAGIVSDKPLAVNEFNFVSGKASLEREFTSTLSLGANEMSSVLAQPLDTSEYKNGLAIIPLVLQNAGNIARIQFVLETDDTNYLTMSSLVDSVGDNLIDGLNMVRFRINQAVETGTVDYSDITKWKLRIYTVDGTTETVLIDKITLQKAAHYYFEYYSNRMFIDGSTGAWKTLPVKGDKINLAEEARDILHYETVLLIAQANTKIRQGRSAFDNFTAQLGRVYQSYWTRFPSSEVPMSYNHLHGEATQLPDYVGQNIQADFTVQGTTINTTLQFADNETPSGVIDGSNQSFTLAHAPNEPTSLLLYLNGQYLNQGVDYTLSGNVITMATAPNAMFSGLPFKANYRYTV
jgi:hypothetical protein